MDWRWLLAAVMTMALLAASAAHLATTPNAAWFAPASPSTPTNPVQPRVGD